jgi:Mn2+/Fe2+ NRAMP family transporter
MAFDFGGQVPRRHRLLAATLIGFAMGFLPINPIQLLVWTAVINGVVAVPIMAMMMLIVTNRAAMGLFQARPSLAWAGWGQPP